MTTVTFTLQRLLLIGLIYLFYMTFTLAGAKSPTRDSARYNDRSNRRAFYGDDRSQQGMPLNKRSSRSEKPNIILIITDDQDEMLGSMSTMTKTMKIMGQEGVRFNNSFVSTPMCCPSRSSLLTGLYPHNHNVYTNNENCSGIEWQRVHEPRTFAKYLSDAGYRTGYFGKYLNEYNGTYIPPGWREWVGLYKNSQFYNYTLNFNGQKVKHDDNYYRDYFTDLIANDSVTFLKQSKQYFPTKPVMMMLSVPAPHGPEDSAPQYQHMFANNTLHRTPSWNYMNNSDKQWLLQKMEPLTPTGVAFTDILQQKRLQTLQSVDSLVEKVHHTLRLLEELDNTYIIYTSDHGYHLGQFGIVKGKALPYDFDTRVPMFIRGPGILKDTRIPNIVGNVDVAPTILDMAGISIPDHMDGRSLLKLMKEHKSNVNYQGDFVHTRRPWRDSFLIERGKVTEKLTKVYEKKKDEKIINDHEEQLLPYAHPKLRRTLRICRDPNNQPPCTEFQKWVCFRDSRNRKRVKKCRNYNNTNGLENELDEEESNQEPVSLPQRQENGNKCDCRNKKQKLQYANYMSPEEEERQRMFLRNHLSLSDFSPRFRRSRRSLIDQELEQQRKIIALQLEMNKRRCRYYPNETFACDRELTNDPEKWESHRQQLDEMIAETKKRLKNLKKIRKNMKRQKKKMLMNKERQQTHRQQVEEQNFDYGKKRFFEEGYEDDELFDENWTGDEDEEEEEDEEDEEDDCNCEEDNSGFEVPHILTGYGDDEEFEETGDDAESTEEDDVPLKGKKAKSCHHNDLKCTKQDNTHWKTPPYWTYGPFCFCTNAVTNTYWCLRTINETHDFLYCEFIDSFLSYYDLRSDPYQLRNQIKSLDYGIMQQLHDELMELRGCEGWKQCSKSRHDNHTEKKRRRRRRKVRQHHRRRKRLIV